MAVSHELASPHGEPVGEFPMDTACMHLLVGLPVERGYIQNPQDCRAINEAAGRFAVWADEYRSQRVTLDARQIADGLSRQPPPLAYLLLAANRFMNNEHTRGEMAARGAASSANALLQGAEVTLSLASLVVPKPLKGVVEAPAAFAAVAAHGVESATQAADAQLHRTASALVRQEHGLSYIDNHATRRDEHSLAAWMLAWSLDRLVDLNGNLQPGCHQLAENLAGQLLALRQGGIMIAINGKPRPAGIELIDLCQALEEGHSIEAAVRHFRNQTVKERQKRAAANRHELRDRRRSSEPRFSSKVEMLPSVRQYQLDVTLPTETLLTEVKRTKESLVHATDETQRDILLETLLRLSMAVKERRDILATSSEEYSRFHAEFQGIWREQGRAMRAYLFKELPTIDEGHAPFGTLRLLYYALFEANLFSWEERSGAADALAHAAYRWYGHKFPDKDLYKTKRAGDKVEETYERPFSTMTGLLQKGHELLIKTFVHELSELAGYPPDVDQDLAGKIYLSRRKALFKDVPRKGIPRSQLIMQLPRAAQSWFEKG